MLEEDNSGLPLKLPNQKSPSKKDSFGLFGSGPGAGLPNVEQNKTSLFASKASQPIQ